VAAAAILDVDGTLVDTTYHGEGRNRRRGRARDTPWDVEAARRAGLETLCVITGGFSEQELLDSGAAGVFESVAELRGRLDETPLS
jgi:phosphoglycolate phosphatase-like HAD superfamily hydrolase